MMNKFKGFMTEFYTADVEPGNWVIVDSEEYLVETKLEADGWFWASNNSGLDVHFHVNDIDSLRLINVR